MADLYRGARRYDLHLSGPQVAGIVLGSLVTLGLAFGIGVGFGRRLATVEPSPKVGPEPVTEKVEAPDAGTHDFTYQAELTKTDPPPPKPAPPLAPPKPGTGTVAPPAPSPAAAEVAVAPDAGTPSVVIGMPTRVPPPAPAPPAAPPPREEPAPKAPAKTEAPAAKTPAKTETAPAKVDDSSDKFTVQFTATVNQTDAEKLARHLKDAGYSPSVIAADVPGKGHVYRVRAGHFPTREAAEAFRDQAQARHKFTGMVMPSK